LDQENIQEEGPVQNVASYIGEYIGTYGEALFDRGLEELIFRAVCWATGTQMVRFSNGANEYIDDEFESDIRKDDNIIVRSDQVADAECIVTDSSDTVDRASFETVGMDWTIKGIGRVDFQGEAVYEVKNSSARYIVMEDASHLDPPIQRPSDRPRKRTTYTSFEEFSG